MNVRIFWVCAMKCMCAQTRPRFILSFERVFGGMEFEPMLTPREKSHMQDSEWAQLTTNWAIPPLVLLYIATSFQHRHDNALSLGQSWSTEEIRFPSPILNLARALPTPIHEHSSQTKTLNKMSTDKVLLSEEMVSHLLCEWSLPDGRRTHFLHSVPGWWLGPLATHTPATHHRHP